MKLSKHLAAIALAATLLSSCSEENPWGTNSGEGHVQLRVEVLGDVEAAVPAVRAVTTDVVTPPLSAFSVSMVKEGGGYSKNCTFDEFLKEESFPVGNYTLSVSYGDEKSQGRVLNSEFGYEHAYYYGETEISIKDGETTPVTINVKLQNAVVVIEYTDAFKKYFKDYSTTLQATGNESINLGDNEAMNYVQPGNVTITIDATQQNGKKLTLSPKDFPVEAAHAYKLRYNIFNGEIDNAQLWIEFDENLTTEKVIVNLSDELNNTRAPQVTTKGFNSGESLASDPANPYSGEAKFAAIADGGIKEAILTLLPSADYSPTYWGADRQIDLCKATAEQKEGLEADGIKVMGLFKDVEPEEGQTQANLSTMCEVDFAGLFQHLNGECGFEFQVKDSLDQVNETVRLKMVSVPIEKNAVCDNGIEFGEYTTEILVGYNGPAPTMTSPFTFVVKDSNDNNHECTVSSVEATTLTRTDYPVKYYKYKVTVPDIAQVNDYDEFNVNVLFNGVDDGSMVVPVAVKYPTHTMTYDAMTRQLRWRVDFPGLASKANKEELLAKCMNRLKIFVDGAEKAKTYDSTIDAYVIDGLTAAQTYTVKTSLHANQTADTQTSVKMETAAPVPNGDFEELTETINATINQGGQWTNENSRFATRYQTTLTMVVKEPKYWNTTNSQTCNLYAHAVNSWYVIPSVYNTTLTWISNQPKAGETILGKFIGQDAYTSTAEIYSDLKSAYGNNAMVIRNVAWDSEGVSISDDQKTGNGSFSNYYCSNEPSSIANITAGRMYLATGDSEGVSFTERPKKLKGYYRYEQDSQDTSEKGKIEVEIISGSTTLVSKSYEFEPKSNYTSFEIPVDYSYAFGQKPTILKISISSSNKTSDIKTTNYCDKDECCSRGAQLTIDNLFFEY